MTSPGGVAVILLAAGLSQRFGPQDKLLACLDGKPLIQHSIDLLAEFEFGERIAVIRSGAPHVASILRDADYRLVMNLKPELGLGASLALGAAAIESSSACLIYLADMPFVTKAHVQAILSAEGDCIASSVARIHQPPALLSKEHFNALAHNPGPNGARQLLRGAKLVVASWKTLADVDLPEDLIHDRFKLL